MSFAGKSMMENSQKKGRTYQTGLNKIRLQN